MRALIRRAFLASVWAPGAISEDDDRVKYLIGVGFPWSSVCLFLFGLGGIFTGIPALDDVFNPTYSRVWSALLAFLAFAVVVGIAYPARAWRVEFFGRTALCALLGLYGLCLILAAFQTGELGRAPVGFLPVASLGPQMWRVADVYREKRLNGWR